MKHAERVSPQRLAAISKLAHKMWFGFAAQRDSDLHGDFLANGEIFDSLGPAALNQHALAFFKYCVKSALGANDGAVVLTKLTGKRSAPSWLWHRNWQVAWMLLDLEQVESEIQGEREIKKVATRLILHEAGHVVMHFHNLRSRGSTRRRSLPNRTFRGVPSVSEKQEEEAWIFCGIVLGLALGQLARRWRPKITDRAWPSSC